MADNISTRPEDFCPKCNAYLPAHFADQKKKKLFEKQYSEILKRHRAHVRLCGRLSGMLIGLSVYVLLIVFSFDSLDKFTTSLKRIFSGGSGYDLVFLIILFFLGFGFIGFFAGTNMLKSQVEKQLWQNFDPDRREPNVQTDVVDVL